MYGNYGRRSPSPLRNQVGALRRGSVRLGGIIPPPPPPPPPSEPDRDEAFVQETGIKVYTSVPPRVVKRREEVVPEEEHDDSEDDDDEEDDDDDEDGEGDDDCYEIIMDDAIIEEDNEDDDDDDDNVHQTKPGAVNSSSKAPAGENDKPGSADKTSSKTTSKETPETLCGSKKVSSKASGENACNSDSTVISTAHPSLSGNKSSSGVSSNGSSAGVLHGAVSENFDDKMPPVKINDNVELPNLAKPVMNSSYDSKNISSNAGQNNSSGGSGSDMSRSSSNGSNNSVKMSANLSTSLKGLNLILSPTSTAPPTQAYVSLSTHGTPTKESPGDLFLTRGKPGRMSLPLRDRFIARPAALQDHSGNSATLDSRTKDGSLRPIRTIWFRRSFKNSAATVSTHITCKSLIL
ncbi:hypothetical protein FHG87_001876 [Trinorchestia longiramus]|nr:hypothetical protein FHG87_001876 [Trinorchestia longiramus]